MSKEKTKIQIMIFLSLLAGATGLIAGIVNNMSPMYFLLSYLGVSDLGKWIKKYKETE